MKYNDFLKSITENRDTTDRIFLNTFGVDKEKICKNVIISPGWNPERVFDMDKAEEIVSSSPLFGFKVWNISFGKSTITYVRTGHGAPMVLDVVLMLGMTECENILFLSSIGALSEKIKVGDIIIPEYAVCGDGASRYIGSGKKLSDVFGEKVYPNKDAIKSLSRITESCCKKNCAVWHYGKTFCADTIMAQYGYIKNIIDMGCNSIDMESAAAFRSAELTGVSAAAIMLVSDNTVLNQSLLSGKIDEKEKLYRRNVRGTIIPEIVKNYFVEMI